MYSDTKTNQLKFKIIFIDKCTKVKDCFHFKDRTPDYLRSNCVYHITCSCGMSYVGQTERNIKIRMDEHSKTSGANLSAVGRHLSENPDHTVDFGEPKVLGYCTYKRKRLIKESLFIQELNPELNIQAETKRLFLFNV